MAQKRKTSARKRQQGQQRHERRPARAKRDVKKSDADGVLSDDEWAAVVQHFYRRRRLQKVWGAVLAIVGVLTILNHLLEHTRTIDVLGPVFSSSAQDIVAGFPIGVVMILSAVILFGQLDHHPKRSVVARQRRSR